MHDFPLEELGPRAFEQLTVALACATLGNGVEAFGSGPDNGREATYRGRVNWSATPDLGSEDWDGYVVIQAKQKEHLAKPAENASWLIRQISDELDKWFEPGSQRQPIPDYFLFVTNVRLSSTAGGGIDQVNAFVTKKIEQAARAGSESRARATQVKDWKIWHRDQINMLLTTHPGIRAAFPGMLTTGDLLARVSNVQGIADPKHLETVLTRHAESSLSAERWINFSEAGGTSRASLDEVAIDLSFSVDGRRPVDQVLQTAIELSDRVLKRSHMKPGTKRHLVITGKAGSGKSTTTRFLTQILRSRFVAGEPLPDTPSRVRDATSQALNRIGAPIPRNRRWPMRVDLPTYADALGPSGDKDLVRWIAELVSKRAEDDLKPYALRQWLNSWPTAILLDGLDEVTSPDVRRRVLDEVGALVEQLDDADADALVILTTRPTGYTEKFMPEQFTQADLAPLSSEEALTYGELVTKRRLADDPDRRDQVVTKLRDTAPDSAQGRLMGTPLQVLIMSLILERFGVLPPDRYQLFSRYFDTVLERESAKTTTLQHLLTDHRRIIVEVHEIAGLELQQTSETSRHARALLSPARLREIAEQRLRAVGYETQDGLARVSEQIVQTATERLVLLVPSEDDCFSFEVRSLQELMAANALSRRREDELAQALQALAHSPHWRNTWIFTAGRAFAEGSDERREAVVQTVESIDSMGAWPSWLCPSGPELAGELLSDGMAASAPKWQRRLVDVALRSLAGPIPVDLDAVAAGIRAASPGGRTSPIVGNALRDAQRGNARARTAARVILNSLRQTQSGVRSRRRVPDDEITDNWPTKTLRDLLANAVAEVGYELESDALVDGALEDFADIHVEVDADGNPINGFASWSMSTPRFAQALLDPSASDVLRGVVGTLGPDRWYIERTLSRIARTTLARMPARLAEPQR